MAQALLGAYVQRVIPSLLNAADVTPRQVEAWSALAGRALEPNPCFEPEFLLADARQGVDVTLLTVHVGSEMVALLPLYRERLPWGGVAIPVWCVPNTLGIPLLDAQHAAPALTLALDFLSRRTRLRKLLLVPRAPVDGPVAVALDRAAGIRLFRGSTVVRCPIVRRRAENTYLDQTLYGRHRNDVKRRKKNLERLLLQPLRLVDRAEDPGAVEKFLSLEASGWKGRQGTAMLCVPGRGEWFREVCAGFRRAGRLRILSLEAGTTVVSMKCSVTAGGGLFDLKTAYEERFARFSPGVLLEIEAVSAFHEERQHVFMNASTNYTRNPLFWLYPDARLLADCGVTLGGPLLRVAVAGLLSSRKLIRSAMRLAGHPRRVGAPNESALPG